ncbi:hypothetical protein ANO11243_025170 [Dothideomycetidae sp. 11243]|nr:hypothetical protein ANO11243_025170 [fungal sp. No.11243]
MDNQDYTATSLTLTTALLSENPEYYSIWNYRRLILQDVFTKELSEPQAEAEETPPEKEISLLLKEDLQFVTSMQRINPKVYWMWNHRAWLLGKALEYLPTPIAIQFWTEELGLVTKMLVRDDRNFHGWSYRRIVTDALEELGFRSLQSKADTATTKQEFTYSDKMVRSNFSNFSAWHHRLQQVRKQLDIEEANDAARRAAYDAELALASELLNLSDEDRRTYVEGQMEAVKEILEDNEDCKWIYQSLLGQSELYIKVGGDANKADMSLWLDKLETLDPLRRGRWMDWRKKLAL